MEKYRLVKKRPSKIIQNEFLVERLFWYTKKRQTLKVAVLIWISTYTLQVILVKFLFKAIKFDIMDVEYVEEYISWYRK